MSLISVRDGLCNIAIEFTKEELVSIIENTCTCYSVIGPTRLALIAFASFSFAYLSK